MKTVTALFSILSLSAVLSGCGDSRTTVDVKTPNERVVEKKVEVKEKDNGTIEVKEKTKKVIE